MTPQAVQQDQTTATLSFGGKSVSLPIVKGTEDELGVDIRTGHDPLDVLPRQQHDGVVPRALERQEPGRRIEQLEQRLEAAGFLRVSRQALVNLQRVRELSPGFKGGFYVLMDGPSAAIPVSRRRVPALRAAIGL